MITAPNTYVCANIVRVGLLFCAMAALSAYAAESKRILMLHSYGRNTSPYDAVTSSFRTELLHAWPGQAAFYDFALEANRPDPRENEAATVEVLRTRFVNVDLDLVVAIGAPAARFYGAHRGELFPSVPLLMLAMDQKIAPIEHLKLGDSIVGVKTQLAQVLSGILELLPDTTTVAMVLGDSPGERYWLDESKKAFAPFMDRVTVVWLNELTLPQIRDRVGKLGPGAVVLYGLFLVDAAGIPYEQDYAIKELYAAAKVPMFGFFAEQVGRGIVGGALLPSIEEGAIAAKVASRRLRGESKGEPSATFLDAAVPQFDWRELQRWKIDESRLPPGSIVQFRPPSMWDEHKATVVASAAVVVLQGALITALLVQLKRRHQAERESFALSSRLITAHEDERRRLARELHDDVTQRLARLAIDAARSEADDSSVKASASRSLHGELVRLSEDVHALSYRLHPSILDDLGLEEALRAECEQISRSLPFRVDVDVHRVPVGLSGDTALCVFRVAQEALRNVVRHAKASVAIVTLAHEDGGLLLAVTDDGVGFDIDAIRTQPSLGCASMGERVRLLGGKLAIRSQAGRGTTVSAWVPLVTATI